MEQQPSKGSNKSCLLEKKSDGGDKRDKQQINGDNNNNQQNDDGDGTIITPTTIQLLKGLKYNMKVS